MTSITIVTPSLNQGRFLKEALESVRSQGVAGVEHLVLDGGSSDETLEVLGALEGRAEWSYVRWQSAPDDGQSDALNRGFARATGEIVGWLNADDRYRAGCFEYVLEAFACHPELDVIYGDVAEIDVHGDLLRVRREVGFSRFLLLYHHVLYIPTPSAFFRRRVFDDGNWLRTDLHYAMDYEFFVRLAAKGYRIDRVPRVLAEFRLHTESKSVCMSPAQAEEVRQVRRLWSPIWRKLRPRSLGRAALFAMAVAAGGMRRAWKFMRGDYFAAELQLPKKGEV